MKIYKHIIYNSQYSGIEVVLKEVSEISKEWCFERVQPVNNYEYVAIFSRWENEFVEMSKNQPDPLTDIHQYSKEDLDVKSKWKEILEKVLETETD